MMNHIPHITGLTVLRRRLLLTMIVCLTAAASLAQKLSVSSFQAVNQIIAADDRQLDNNNEPCALVKLQGAEVDSIAGAFVVKRRGAETWAYVTNGRYRLTLFKRGFESLVVNFRDYNIDGAEGNRVYRLVVSAPTGNQGQVKTADYLTLWVTPKTAAVTIDGQPCSVDPDEGTVNEVLTYGTHTVQVQAPGYETVSKTFSFAAGSEPMRITLQSLAASVVIRATTPGTLISVNNENKGSDSCTVKLSPRTYIIKGEKKGCQTQELTLTITDASSKTVIIPALVERTGSVNISYKPTGSEIRIDGRQMGTSPRIVPDIGVGQHNVEISRDGYQTFKGTITIKENEESTLTGSLVRSKAKKEKAMVTPIERTSSTTESRKKSSTSEAPAITFGVRAGLNMATTQFESPYDGASMTMGFHIGATASIRLTNGFYLAPALLYSGKGYKYEKDKIDETCSASYITVPIHLSPRFAIGQSASLQLLAGPYIGFAIGGTIDSKSKGKTDFTKYYNGFDYGVSLGGGAQFARHIFAGVTYEIGFAEYRNRCLCISLGYDF